MPLAVAQVLYLKDLPSDIAENLVAAQTITHIVVYPKAGADVPKPSPRPSRRRCRTSRP